jgi:3-hydroxyisobutyrate dehydrogenase-like beta-hydroxyacid dehydrogenase
LKARWNLSAYVADRARRFMNNTKIGFIGLGHVGGKPAGSLLRHGIDFTVRDLTPELVDAFVQSGAAKATSPQEMARSVDVLISCRPSPAAAAVMEHADGALAGLSPGKIWLEMTTTDSEPIKRLEEACGIQTAVSFGLQPLRESSR